MCEIKQIKTVPKEAEKEITFMLFNYNNIDILIENRKKDLIDQINVSNNAYIKSLKQTSNTIENIAINFDYDKKINRLKKWKRVISLFRKRLFNEKIKIYYQIIDYKYMKKIKEDIIIKILNIDKKTLKKIDLFLKELIYENAIEKNLYKEVIQKCQNVEQ